MQTALADFIRDTPLGRAADAILRRCVHCGFCNATCPTYLLFGDELDGPRGRIYLIKQALEGHAVTDRTLTRLDRCLACRSCETTCPSGVHYGELLEIGRIFVEQQGVRPRAARLARWLLRRVVPYPRRFAALLGGARLLRPLLPPVLEQQLPPRPASGDRPAARHARRMLVLEGCVQSVIAPGINAAAARVLDRFGISLIAAPAAGCCGAASHHGSGVEQGLDLARRNIAAWWPFIEAGTEAIVMTASGCGVHVKDYGRLLAHDPAYADQAGRVSELTKDIGEVLAREDLSALPPAPTGSRIAFHSPCTLQHGQRLHGTVEKILRDLGFALTPVPEAHLCCGSAGTYSILQPAIARQLRAAKLSALQTGRPGTIVTANIGCLDHLRGTAAIPVRHWIELLAD